MNVHTTLKTKLPLLRSVAVCTVELLRRPDKIYYTLIQQTMK